MCACYWVDGWASTGCVLCVDASAHHQHVPSPRCCCPVRTSLAYAAYLCQMKPSTALATYSRYTSACYQPGNASMPEVTGYKPKSAVTEHGCLVSLVWALKVQLRYLIILCCIVKSQTCLFQSMAPCCLNDVRLLHT